MSLDDFRDILLSADPAAKKDWGPGQKANYTVWTPGGIRREMSDDGDEGLIQRVYVDRFTKTDKDPVATAIWRALESSYIPFEYERISEPETKYIHHAFTCHVQVNSI